MINKDDQDALFQLIARNLKKDVRCYAFGGNAMMYYGYKAATKDIDILFEKKEERDNFVDALRSLNYQKMSLKTRDSDFKDGQNLAPQTLTLRRWQTNKPPERLSNTEGRHLPPMSGAFTHTSPRFVEASPDPQNLTPWSQVLSAKELVEKFYSRLGQRASKTKREQSVQECLGLLQQGFTLEEVDYAISWFIEQHRTVGSFTQLVQCIDQALKERQTTQPRPETQQHIRAADC